MKVKCLRPSKREVIENLEESWGRRDGRQKLENGRGKVMPDEPWVLFFTHLKGLGH